MESKEWYLELFLERNTRRGDKITPSSDFKRVYGNMSISEAFEVYYTRIVGVCENAKKIRAFEMLLRNIGCVEVQSNISESRYYTYNGWKFRFSGHAYPTGSMTDWVLKKIDFATNPEIIEKIDFKNNTINLSRLEQISLEYF